MNPLPPEVNTPELKPEKVGSLIKRFGIGAITGVAIAALYWSYTGWFGYAEPITTGIIGSLILAIFCGLLTLKWGYKILGDLLGLLP
ncbi:hypothetical protein H6G97_45000 [Nostoc flagelliforme FACHB-838]|uniref:Uncharacterized protein n=1 Tax=Nostoc flagelliforme FACHB-838 TaxID=2692904 RepID=A0ABR8E4T7_9NOSO|nr:hypothetical protein [Nostoc flagelliforme]MBD2536097.1 hypothetical protein [Nostoc flagelliforme FACHB-838]